MFIHEGAEVLLLSNLICINEELAGDEGLEPNSVGLAHHGVVEVARLLLLLLLHCLLWLLTSLKLLACQLLGRINNTNIIILVQRCTFNRP